MAILVSFTAITSLAFPGEDFLEADHNTDETSAASSVTGFHLVVYDFVLRSLALF